MGKEQDGMGFSDTGVWIIMGAAALMAGSWAGVLLFGAHYSQALPLIVVGGFMVPFGFAVTHAAYLRQRPRLAWSVPIAFSVTMATSAALLVADPVEPPAAGVMLVIVALAAFVFVLAVGLVAGWSTKRGRDAAARPRA